MSYLPLIWAGIWRKPVRAALTFLSIANAFLLFGLLQGFLGGVARSASQADADVLFTLSRVSQSELLPVALVDRIKAIHGVKAVSPAVQLDASYQRPTQPITADAVETALIPDVLPGMHIAPAQLAAVRSNLRGAVASRQLAQRFGWKIGDRAPITSGQWVMHDGSRTIDVDIVGIYDAPHDLLLKQAIILNYEYLNQSRVNDVDTTDAIVTRIQDASKAGDIIATIDGLTANSPYETKTTTELAFAQEYVKEIGDVGFVVHGVVGALFFTMLISIGTVISQSINERAREVGILKTIGFSSRQILMLFLSETMIVCGLAAMVGIFAAEVLFHPILARLTNTVITPGPLALWALGAAGVLALVCGLPPSLRAMRLQVVDALNGR